MKFKIYFQTSNKGRRGRVRHKIFEAENSAYATAKFWQWTRTLKRKINAEIKDITRIKENE